MGRMSYLQNRTERDNASKDSMGYNNLGEGWVFLISFMRWFPDMVQDLLRSDDADYELTIIQRVIMRAKARYQYCDITGCRGLTKSFCSINEEIDEMILWPSVKTAYFGPSFRQTSKIGSQTFKQIRKDYPAIAEHIRVDSDAGDRFEISTQFGSQFTITSFRGTNIHKVVAEEYAQENAPRFDEEEFKTVVLPAVRLRYLHKGKRVPSYIAFKQHSITSAGRRQNHAYETRCRHLQMMNRGESAFVMDVPYDVSLLCQMRPVAWAESLRGELTPDEWAREMESRYTGTDQNPVVPDTTLSESRTLLCMEEHHCCRDYNNKLKPEDVFYIVGYDVSYADGANNAKCACVVVKCTKHTEWLKRDRYKKQVVWVNDWQPASPMAQAQKLKQVWNRYCVEGSTAYIAIDAWQYGTAVLQALMMDLGDDTVPLCTYNHTLNTECELENSIPVIYPIKAGGVGTTDPDSEMIRNAEIQFDNHNIELLTSNYGEGIEAYKKLHRIRDDRNDYAIYVPYKKTNELIGQIQNLKKVPNASGVSEKRISSRIQRDSWSALKYALRLAQILEKTYLIKQRRKSDWDDMIKNADSNSFSDVGIMSNSRMITGRRGGRLF